MSNYSLQQLAEEVGAKLVGDGDIAIHSIGTLSSAGDGQISFLSNSKYRSQLSETKASAVIVGEDDLPHTPCAALVMKNPYVGFALVAQILDSTPDAASEISPQASIDNTATLGANVKVGPFVVIESGVCIEDDVQIGAGCFIGKDTRVGKGTKIWANTTLYHNVIIGNDCLIQSNTVIGADGFGYANDSGKWVKIPQVGRVIIGDNVEIGASTTIDRGALEDTVIENGVIIDNQVQIAHNVVIKESVALAGCTVVAGSTTIGKYCTIGGMSAIAGHVEIADNVHFTGMAMVTKGVAEPGLYSSGIPVAPNKDWRRNAITMRNISSLNQRVKKLEKQAQEK
ncbi:UDP-3-O-(3-hydroxymyristoyl)glucosamine N-acyltransferase [Alteromonadaceae bacterium M269]|nr:UDP-3-O-(3-hydroxymyristoyl)glucosamine N-acyltransferase [Alteromonadaceae bacterium M269]